MKNEICVIHYVKQLREICMDSVGLPSSWGGTFMVTSVASQFCRILFLWGRLHLSHWKVETLVSCTPNNNACVHHSVYRMYLSRTSAPGTCHGFLDLNEKSC